MLPSDGNGWLSKLPLQAVFTATALLLLCSNAATEAARHPTQDSTPVFIIRTEEEAKQVARVHATSNNELLFTTCSFTHRGFYAGHMGDFAAHLWQSLREIGRLENTVLFTYDLHTCQGIMARGIPCFLDRWSTQPSQLPGQYGKEVPHWYSKYSWALKFLEWGYTAVFVELDMVFLKDPLPFFNKEEYDFQGLSDWRVPEVPDAKTRYQKTCQVYHMWAGDDGYQILQWGPSDDKDPRQTYHVNPCVSTGFWFFQPTEPAKRYLQDFIEVAVYSKTEETDQIVWNEMIMAYLIGTSKYKPLRIGLLDEESFSNFEVYNWRVEQSLPTRPVMLHCGALHPSDKYPMMRSLGFWKADYWTATSAEYFMQKLSQQFTAALPTHRRQSVETA